MGTSNMSNIAQQAASVAPTGFQGREPIIAAAPAAPAASIIAQQGSQPETSTVSDKLAMVKSNKVYIGLLIIVIICGVGIYFLYKWYYKGKDSQEDDEEGSELRKFRNMSGAGASYPPGPPLNQGNIPRPIGPESSGMPQNYQQGPPPNYQQGPPPNYQQGPPPNYQQGPPPNYQQGPPQGPGQGKREQQHRLPPASSGFPQTGSAMPPMESGASEEDDPMFTKLSDLPN